MKELTWNCLWLRRIFFAWSECATEFVSWFFFFFFFCLHDHRNFMLHMAFSPYPFFSPVDLWWKKGSQSHDGHLRLSWCKDPFFPDGQPPPLPPSLWVSPPPTNRQRHVLGIMRRPWFYWWRSGSPFVANLYFHFLMKIGRHSDCAPPPPPSDPCRQRWSDRQPKGRNERSAGL